MTPKVTINQILILIIIILLGVAGYLVKADKISWSGLWGRGDDTEGWKTYRNEKYGFEFKYPSAWVSLISDNQSNLGLWTSENWKNDNTLYSHTAPSLLLDIFTNESGASFGEWSKVIEFWENPEKIIIDGRLSAWRAIKPGMGDGDHMIYIPSVDNKFFVAIYVLRSYPNDPMLKKVMDSFKFIK